MNRAPCEFFRTPPSPRTDSVTRMPLTDGGQTMPVGWNWRNSMLISVAPDRSANACPSPVYSQKFDVTLYDLPTPPVASTSAGHLRTGQQNLGHRHFSEDPDAALVITGRHEVVLLQRDDLLLEGADQLQAGTVADVRQARVLVAAEVALGDAAVRGAVEQRAVRLQFPDPVRRLLGVQFGHPEVVEELPAAHGVPEVHHPVVVAVDVAHRGCRAAFGHHRVRLAEQRFGDDGRLLAGQPGLDRRA